VSVAFAQVEDISEYFVDKFVDAASQDRRVSVSQRADKDLAETRDFMSPQLREVDKRRATYLFDEVQVFDILLLLRDDFADNPKDKILSHRSRW